MATLVPLIIGIGLLWPPETAKGDVETTVNTTPTTIPNAVPTTKVALQQLAREAAARHGINESRFLRTQECEIKKHLIDGKIVWDYKAQSDHIRKDGTRENSWGAWQINLDAHKDITKAQAQDPYWSTEWSAKQFAEGNAKWWTCFTY